MDLHPSRITSADDGWTWLAPGRRGAQVRLAFWSVVLSLLLIGLAAAATLPPTWIAVPLVAVVLACGLWLARTLWSRAHSAVAVSALGIAVRDGFDVAQIAWPALLAVMGEPHGTRLRIVIEAQGARHRTAATFSRDTALRWISTCAEQAERHHMGPVELDEGAGFRTT